jgi:hypothetical protein
MTEIERRYKEFMRRNTPHRTCEYRRGGGPPSRSVEPVPLAALVVRDGGDALLLLRVLFQQSEG